MRVACQIGLQPTGGGGAHGPVASVARCVHARVAVVVNCALDGWQVKSTASIQALRKPCVHYTMQHATRALYNATCPVPCGKRCSAQHAARKHVASIHATRKPPCVAQCTSHRCFVAACLSDVQLLVRKVPLVCLVGELPSHLGPRCFAGNKRSSAFHAHLRRHWPASAPQCFPRSVLGVHSAAP